MKIYLYITLLVISSASHAMDDKRKSASKSKMPIPEVVDLSLEPVAQDGRDKKEKARRFSLPVLHMFSKEKDQDSSSESNSNSPKSISSASRVSKNSSSGKSDCVMSPRVHFGENTIKIFEDDDAEKGILSPRGQSSRVVKTTEVDVNQLLAQTAYPAKTLDDKHRMRQISGAVTVYNRHEKNNQTYYVSSDNDDDDDDDDDDDASDKYLD